MKASTQRYRILTTLSLFVCGGWACAHPPGQQPSIQQPSAQPTSTQQPSPQATPTQQTSTQQTSSERAQAILRAGRTALGGEEKLASVRSLSLAGELRRKTQAGDGQSGDIRMEFLLPDKFMRTETVSPFPGIELTLIRGLNGDDAWSDSRSSSLNANMTLVRPEAKSSQDQREQLLKASRAEFTRNILAFLLTSPPSSPLQFAFAGDEEVTDKKVDALHVAGPDGFAVRLFFDQKSHLPVSMSYRGVDPRMKINQQNTRITTTKEEARKTEEFARNKRPDAPQNAPRQNSVIVMRFSDYRAVDGILMPRHITRAVNGNVDEEWNLKTIKVNPPLKPQGFRK
jgi:hypothetical protein